MSDTDTLDDFDDDITVVYLRSGRALVVHGNEYSRCDDSIIVYPTDPEQREVLVNWDAVEFVRVITREQSQTLMKEALSAMDQLLEVQRPEPGSGGQYL